MPLTVAAAGAAILSTIRALPYYRTAKAVVSYSPCGNEVPTEGLLYDVVRSGRPLYLPVNREQPGFARWKPGDPLVRAAIGVPEPRGSITPLPEVPTVAFVPLVACTRAGDRLGRGGGFYDRAFGRECKLTTLIGLAFEFQILTELPRDPWDVRLDYVITERRVVWCKGEETGRWLYPQEGAQKRDGICLDSDRGNRSRGDSGNALRDVSSLPNTSIAAEC